MAVLAASLTLRVGARELALEITVTFTSKLGGPSRLRSQVRAFKVGRAPRLLAQMVVI
jgi:hypothetical protein